MLPSTLKTCSYEESFYLEENVLKSHVLVAVLLDPLLGENQNLQ